VSNHRSSDSVKCCQLLQTPTATKESRVRLSSPKITAVRLRAGLESQSYCRTAYMYISTRFWLHCSPSSAYFGPTDSSFDIYNLQAHKFLADVSLHCGPSAEVIQINGLDCDKLYTANVFEKSRTPKRFFPSNYRHVFAMHLTLFYITSPA
jgi:hypothetical protein